jgi:broad specificity phosphatase PhoE
MFGDETLELVKEAFDRGVRHVVLLMRHSAREFEPGRHDLLNPLTEEGRELARRFGRELPKEIVVRGYASPAERCMETAQLILRGHAVKGGETTRHRPVEGLGVFYVLDQMKMYRAMTGAGGQVPFLESWYEGGVSSDVMIPAHTAASIVADVMREKLRQPLRAPQLDLCVSHDMTLYLVRNRLLNERAADYGEVRFLDGIQLYEHAGDTWLESLARTRVRLDGARTGIGAIDGKGIER